MSDMTDELREALDAMEVAVPMADEGTQGTFVAPADLDQMLVIFEAASAHLSCGTVTDEQVEAAASAFFDLDSAIHTDLTGWDRKLWAARAALEAAALVQVISDDR